MRFHWLAVALKFCTAARGCGETCARAGIALDAAVLALALPSRTRLTSDGARSSAAIVSLTICHPKRAPI
jgi:hypothetical protein